MVCSKEKHRTAFKQYNTKPGYNCCDDCSRNRAEQWCLKCEEKYGRDYCYQKYKENAWILANTWDMRIFRRDQKIGKKIPVGKRRQCAKK
jgi:hypothetical protein